MCKFKDGDFIKIIQPKFETCVVTFDEREFIGIFCSHVLADDKEMAAVYVVLTDDDILAYTDFDKRQIIVFDERYLIEKATEEDKARLINALKRQGKKWNEEKLLIESIN